MSQIVVWRGTIVGENKQDFLDWLHDEGFKSAEYLEEFKTLPDISNGKAVEGTGVRNDLLFSIGQEDIPKFAIWRLQYGMSWWEDYLDNEDSSIIPDSILNKYERSW